MKYYCGIDLGNKSSTICIINSKREVIGVYEVTTSAGGVKMVFEKYSDLTCIVEAAPLAEWVCKEVERYGHIISIVCARKAKIALASQNNKKKTDKRDAHALAELCRSEWYEAVHRKSDEGRELRSYLTARKQLVEGSLRIASSIRGILRAHGVKLVVKGDDNSFSATAEEAINQLPELAQEGVRELLRSYEMLHKQQRDMYKRIKRYNKTNEVAHNLQSIPGVGPATAAAFVATIDDPNRFADAGKVAAYVGLTPSVHQSGETEYRGHITKTGDKLLRWLLVEAAHILLTRSHSECELRQWGLRLQREKGLGKARVAVARRLCGVMWRMWMDGKSFHAPSAVAA